MHGRRQTERKYMLAPGLRHFAPGFGEDAGEFVLVDLSHKIVKAVGKKNQTGYNLKRLHIGVRPQTFLANQRADALDFLARITRFHHEYCEPLSVERAQILAPFQVANTASGVIQARRGPPLDVMAADGDAQEFGGIWSEALQSLARVPSVHQCRRLTPALDQYRVRIAGVGCVEPD